MESKSSSPKDRATAHGKTAAISAKALTAALKPSRLSSDLDWNEVLAQAKALEAAGCALRRLAKQQGGS